jgi:hypothetical protein
MFEIIWEGTYGYGDILGAYCHASRISAERKEQVQLKFIWYEDRQWTPKENKFNEKDPETVLERLNAIRNHVDMSDVIIKHENVDAYKGTEPYQKDRPRYSNRTRIYDWKYTVWDMAKEPEDLGHIAVWHPKTNIERFNRHPLRHWKEPISDKDLDEYYDYVSKETGKKIELVHYRMPVDEVFNIIRTSSFCIGHDGIGNVISKNYFKPIIVFSKQTLSKTTSGPWIYHSRKITERHRHVRDIIFKQKYLIDECKKNLQKIQP